MARKISFDAPVSDNELGAQAQPTPLANRVRPLLGLERPIKPSSALGAISQSLGGITDKARRADEIEQKLIQGQTIVELDPGLIDHSFVADRMEPTDAQSAAFRELIRQHGQNVPILVRPKADQPDRYEVAFGHRRLRAARELGIRIRAVVRALTDEELVIAQGQENSGRTDLTYIERALFAARLETRGFSRDTIMAALNADKAAVSRLVAIATKIPAQVIEAIGAAPAIGRLRWLELVELLEQANNRSRAIGIVKNPEFKTLDSDKRFERLVSALRAKAARPPVELWSAEDGTQAAKIARSGRKLVLTFDDRVTPQFGIFVEQRLQELYDAFKSAKRNA